MLTLTLISRERKVGALHAVHLVRRSQGRIAKVPSSVRAEWNFDLRRFEPRDLVAILVHLHNESRKFLSHLRRLDRNDARGAKCLAEIHPEDSVDSGGKGHA